jgi:predicted outer membrane repeat protein
LTNADFMTNAADGGGAIYASKGSTTVNQGYFECNSSQSYGGGLWVRGQLNMSNTMLVNNRVVGINAEGGAGAVADTAALTAVSFIGNQSDGPNGGGLYVLGTLYLTSTQFISNSTTGGGGGVAAPFSVIATESQFRGNHAHAGGALFGGRVTLSNTDFLSNTAVAEAGGLWAFGASTIINSRFENNSSSAGNGGGLYVSDAVTLIDTKVISNSAVRGGGLLYDTTATSLVVNSIFVHNSAANGGTVIAMIRPGRLDLLHSTLVGNNANSKPAVDILSGTLNITNTIIVSHTIAISNTGGMVYEDYNLFFGSVINTVGVITDGGHSFISDPKFVDPFNGDFHLQFGSEAIDRGIGVGVYTDLDGKLRPVGTGFDIGAYEYQGEYYYLWLPLIRK